VDTTLSILKMLLLGFISFFLLGREKFPHSTTVPIGNILYKLDALGIRGKCYQFIKNLYLTSKASVKIDDQYSESFNIMKGVRQGCPLSPILFNLFNDIFYDFSELGIPLGESRCCGGLFADDIVLCTPSRTK